MKRAKIGALVGLLLLGAARYSAVQAATNLYGTVVSGGDTQLVTVNTATGQATAIGLIGVSQVAGLAGRASDHTLFGSRGASNSNPTGGQIVTIDVTMGSAGTVLFPGSNSDVNGLPIGGLAFLGGVLYGTCTVFDPSRPDALCTINTLTGEASLVNPSNSLDPGFTIEGFDGLASNGSTLYASTRKTGNPATEPRLYTVNTGTGVGSA